MFGASSWALTTHQSLSWLSDAVCSTKYFEQVRSLWALATVQLVAIHSMYTCMTVLSTLNLDINAHIIYPYLTRTPNLQSLHHTLFKSPWWACPPKSPSISMLTTHPDCFCSITCNHSKGLFFYFFKLQDLQLPLEKSGYGPVASTSSVNDYHLCYQKHKGPQVCKAEHFYMKGNKWESNVF